MFDNVNIDWHLSHDEGSTDFSDDETLDDHPRLNGSSSHNHTPPEHLLNTINNSQSPPDHQSSSSSSLKFSRPMSVFTPGRTGGKGSEWILDRAGQGHHHNGTSDSGDSPGSYRNSVNGSGNMPPPPPPQGKKPSLCKFLLLTRSSLNTQSKVVLKTFLLLFS